MLLAAAFNHVLVGEKLPQMPITSNFISPPCGTWLRLQCLQVQQCWGHSRKAGETPGKLSPQWAYEEADTMVGG